MQDDTNIHMNTTNKRLEQLIDEVKGLRQDIRELVDRDKREKIDDDVVRLRERVRVNTQSGK